MVGGHQQPGSDALTCYACGIVGHKRGDSICTASSGAIWAGAPEAWKKRQKKGKGGGRGNGDAKRKQKGRGRGNGNRDDGVCRNWTTGNGYCKFGDNCKFLHSGKKGGDGGGNGNGNGNKTSKKETCLLYTSDAADE